MFGLNKTANTKINPQLLRAAKGLYNRHELVAIDRLGTTITIEAGETFVTEGASGREVVIILEGTAAVSRSGEEIANVGSGDIVGEQAVLTNQPRNASLIATTDLVATVFTPREFRQLLDTCPRLEARTQELMAQRSVSA